MSKTNAVERLDRYIRARYPIIAISSHEESRVIAAIQAIAEKRERKVVTWSITSGISGMNGVDAAETRDAVPALFVISQYDPMAEPVLFVMKDLQKYFADPVVLRYLRDIAVNFEASRHNLILVGPDLGRVPSDLEKVCAIIDYPLPTVDELSAILSKCENDLPSRIAVSLNGGREQVVQSLRGLTAFEAGSVLMNAIAATGELSDKVVPYIVDEKRQIIRKSGVLEFYDTDVSMSSVGGLCNLKHYAEIKRAAFSKNAADFGVDAPKGLLMVGVPGTGKSLTAKAIAGGQMPLLRMDIGALLSGTVGGGEQNMRDALKVAESISPCVLWIDEIEKAMADNSGASDGGVMMRMLGSLLTWMQETTSPVYVVATANNIRSLRPELLRRFDDIVWIDLPSFADRMEILIVHLNKRKQDSSKFNLESVVDAMWGFTGAEIEKVVKAAVEFAFFESKPLDNTHLAKAAAQIIPISATMNDQISEMRSWATGRALIASEPIEPKPTSKKSQRSKADDL